MEYNLLVISNNSSIKQTLPITNIRYTAEDFTDKISDLMEYVLQEDAKNLLQLTTITKDHGTALLAAINRQDPEMVQLLLEHPNIDINKTSMCIVYGTWIKDGDLPFLLAIHNGNLEIVQKFLKNPKLDIRQIYQDGENNSYTTRQY